MEREGILKIRFVHNKSIYYLHHFQDQFFGVGKNYLIG